MAPTAIQRIHEAAREALGTSLDRPVWLDRDLALFGLVDFAGRKRVYVDVPVASVVALGRKDFWSSGDTWRSVAHRLHGDGWPDEVFQYFESPTREAMFPAPGSNHQLRLLVYGGVAECGNGNHRLVAARAWLTHQFGDDAVLLGVRVTAYSIHPCVVPFLRRAVREGQDVLTATPDICDANDCQVGGRPVELLLKTSGNPHRVHAWVGDRLIPLNRGRTFLQRWFRRPDASRADQHQWRTIPVAVVEALLDDAWLAPQLATAETWA